MVGHTVNNRKKLDLSVSKQNKKCPNKMEEQTRKGATKKSPSGVRTSFNK